MWDAIRPIVPSFSNFICRAATGSRCCRASRSTSLSTSSRVAPMASRSAIRVSSSEAFTSCTALSLRRAPPLFPSPLIGGAGPPPPHLPRRLLALLLLLFPPTQLERVGAPPRPPQAPQVLLSSVGKR